MALATSYNVSGDREALTNFLTILEPEDCPKTSSFAKTTKVTNTFQTWQADTLANVDFAGVLEGQDVNAFNNEAANRARFGNYIQKFWRPWMVSDLQEASDPAGTDGEVANSKVKAMRELKRSIEAAIGSDNDMQADTGLLPYKTRGLGKWIQNGAQTDLPVNASYRTPTGSLNATATASLTENNIQDMLQSIYAQTGKVSTYSLVCGPTLKRQFTAFTRTQFASTNVASAIRVLNQKDENKIVSTVDIFEGDFGTLELIPSLFLAADATVNAAAVQNGRGYVLDMDMVELRYNRKPRFQELEDRGGGPRGIVDAICALCVKSPLALGKFAPTA